MSIALNYIKERKQFGKSISEYQATQVLFSSLFNLKYDVV